MKLLKSIFIFLLVVSGSAVMAQTYGCPDPQANNYNPNADVDDGSCCYGNWITVEASDNITYVELFSLQSFINLWWPQIPFDCFPDGCVTVNAHSNYEDPNTFVNVYNNGELVLSIDQVSLGAGYFGYGLLEGQFDLGEVVEGCTSSYACNYNPAATCDDGSCDTSCAGCTDPSAANFDPTATINDGSCCGSSNYLTTYINGVEAPVSTIYFEGYGAYSIFEPEASAGCVSDGCWLVYAFDNGAYSADTIALVDANGLVVASGTFEDFTTGIWISINAIEGCPDPSACNYNPESTCLNYSTCTYECYGCTNPNAGNYDPNATIDDGTCCDNYYTIVADGEFYWNAWSYSSFGGGYGLYPANNGFCIFDGCYNFSTGAQFDPETGQTPDVNWQLLDSQGNVVASGSTLGNAVATFTTANSVEGCLDANACNYDPNVTCNNAALCTYSCYGCTDPQASNFSSEAIIDNGTCCYNEWYTIEATTPGSWYVSSSLGNYSTYGQYPEQSGFCAFDGCGYVSFYPFDYGILEYEVNILNGEGVVVGTLVVDALNYNDYLILDQNSISGCADTYACNYDPNVNCYDYSACDYGCYGCTDPSAPNYDPNATVENNTCCYGSWYTVEFSTDAYWSAYDNQSGAYASGQYPAQNGFCMSGGCFQFQAWSTIGQELDYIVYDVDGQVVLSGTFGLDGQIVLANAESEIVGCTDFNACNYDPMATCNDYMVCDYSCYGCTDPNAPNYDPEATINNGTCCSDSWYNVVFSEPAYWVVVDSYGGSVGGFYPDQAGFCTTQSCLGFYAYAISGNATTFEVLDAQGNVMLSGAANNWGYYPYDLSLGEEIAGCTWPEACNYNPDATCDNGTCLYYCGGCTDPSALNYSSVANYNDGSCMYEIELPNMGMSVIPDAENEQYYVLLSMMNEGNGAPYVLSNDFNDDLTMVEESGQYMAGPYPCNQPVEVRLISMSAGLETYFDAVMEGECVQTIGVDETVSANDLVIFPNPATDVFTISGLQDGMAQVEIRDISGRLVMSRQMAVAGGRIDLQNEFVAGIYQIQCTIGTERYQGRVILN